MGSATGPARHLSSLPDVGVIALVPDLWESPWQSRHYILTRLAHYFHVVWCNPSAGNSRILDSRSPSTNYPANGDVPAGLLIRDLPSWMPPSFFQRSAALARVMNRARLRGVRRQLALRGCDRVVLSLWRPSYAAALDLVPHDVSCRHIDDEYTFSEVEQVTDEREASLIQRVDQVFVSSRGLLDKKAHLNPSTLFVPNGVDFAAYVASWPEPADLQRIPHPRVGYVGLIKRRLDLELVYALAERHRAWSFVFVGPQRHQEHIGRLIGKLMDLPNVHFLGEKRVTALPGYTQHMDACMLCYKVDDYTKFIYPLKLHESLASGRPCVGSPIRTLREFSSVLELACTVEEWSMALAAALTPAGDSKARSAAGRKVARDHDWNRLVHQIATAIGNRVGPCYRRRIQQSMPESHAITTGDSPERP